MRHLTFALLCLGLAGCSEQAWGNKQYANIAATHGEHSRAVNAKELYKVLDRLAQLLYADGFLYSSNGPDPRPARVFSRGVSSFERHAKEPFDVQNTFVIIEKPTSSIDCFVVYNSRKEVYVTFQLNGVTSIENPTIPMNASRRQQIDGTIEKISAYLRAKLPGYRIAVEKQDQS